MNNIYVETMPKDCLDCPCRNSEFMHCNLIYCDHSIGYFNEDELDYKYVPINQDFEELICPTYSIESLFSLFIIPMSFSVCLLKILIFCCL